jgi:hypothetical protein
MGRVRFLADHNLNEQIIDGALRREPTLEFARVRDIGPADLSDPELLSWAASNGFVIVSHDVNTMTAYAYDRIEKGEPMAGLLLVSQFEPIGAVIESLVLISSASEAEEWHDTVAFLPL